MAARLSFLPVSDSLLEAVANIYGKSNVKILNNEIVVLRKPQSKDLYPITMGVEHLANPENIECLADYIMANLNEEFDGVDREKIVNGVLEIGLPSIYSELGIISELQMMLSQFSLEPDMHSRRKILCEELLPLIIEKFVPYACIATTVDVKLQQSIFSILKVGLQLHEYGPEKAIESVEQGMGAGMVMTAGHPVLAMMDAYTCLASSHYTLPLHLTTASFHFIFDGAVILSSGMRSSLQGLFQADQVPMLEERSLRYSLPAVVELDHNYTWRYLRFSIDCINELMAYANNPFNFLNKESQLIPEEQLQFFTAIYLIYADIASINLTANKHIQYHLAFGAIEKIANLIYGHIKDKKPKNSNALVKERNIAHIIFSSETDNKIRSIIKDSIGDTKPDVAVNLAGLSETMYKELHRKLEEMFKKGESQNIGSFYDFRKFYAHGSFLSQDLFKRVFLNTTARVPSEIVFIPYCLMLALSCSPERFFSFFQEQVHDYEYGRYTDGK